MKLRTLASVGGAIALLSAGAASASTGPVHLQRRAEQQTKLLFRELTAPTQIASPATCNEGQRPDGIAGVFMLPTLSFGSGDATFTCHVTTHRVLVDLGGDVATEDKRGDTYTTADGQVLLFTRRNLESICNDALRFFPSPAPATVDSTPVGGTQVSTPAFEVAVNPNAPAPYWQDSVDLGHPGRLAASYCGWKTTIRLTTGQHVIQVDLSGVTGAPTHFTYDITVGRPL
jgi:hypothetical protein